MKNKRFMIIIMMLISMFQMGMVALSPIVSSLTDVFPGTSDTAAQLAMTFMCLCIVLTALCSGAISRIIGRRFMCAGGMALTAVGGLVFGLLFSRMNAKLGAQMPGLAFVILSVSYLMVYASGNLIGILIAGFFGGGSLSVIFPYFLLHIAGRVDPSVSVISSSLILSVGPNLGSFVSPMILTTLAGFMGDTAGSRFMLACAAALILTIVTLVFSNIEGCSNTASVRT